MEIKLNKYHFTGEIRIEMVQGGYILTIDSIDLPMEKYIFTEPEKMMEKIREYINFEDETNEKDE